MSYLTNPYRYAVAGGAITDAIVYGGSDDSPSPNLSLETQLFDGTTVSEGGDMVDKWGKGAGGAKTTNADAIYLGGQYTHLYTNRIGTYTSDTWATNSATLGSSRSDAWGTGSTSSSEGIIYGGDGAGNTSCEEFDGSVVSTGGSLVAGRTQMAGRGTLSSQWCGEGNNGAIDLTSFETYNGSSWTSKGNVGNYARRNLGGGGQDKDDGILVGGTSGTNADAEIWDGSVCIVITELNTGEYGPTAGGSQTSALVMGGEFGGAKSSLLQEWNNTSWITLSATLNTGTNVMNGGAVPA